MFVVGVVSGVVVGGDGGGSGGASSFFHPEQLTAKGTITSINK